MQLIAVSHAINRLSLRKTLGEKITHYTLKIVADLIWFSGQGELAAFPAYNLDS